MLLHSRASAVTRASVGRRPSVRRLSSIKPVFSETVKRILTPNFHESYLFTISSDNFLFSKILIFFNDFFSSSLTSGHIRVKISNVISESTHQCHSQKWEGGGVLPKLFKEFANCQKCANFLSFSLTSDQMGVKVSNDISSEVYPKFVPQSILLRRVSTKVVKRIVNFWQFFFCCCSFFLPV